MKLKTKSLFRNIILLSMLLFAAWWLHFGYRNQQGYCSTTGEKLNDEEKIDRAISTLLSYYPEDQNTMVSQFERELGPEGDNDFRHSVPLKYKDNEHFKQLNKDCCRVVSQPSDIEDAPATFFDRVIGSKASFIEIKYLLRYVDASGRTHEKQFNVTYAITNCGVVWNGF